MMQKHRISTNLGKDQLIKVELKQDFDLLEILSLKFTQKEVYTSLCADYGVVCGRVSVNDGFGVPNARVSIFIPLSETDELDPVLSTLYPYKLASDRNEDGYKYNLLPSRQQHSGHTPTGTFPDQEDILTREEYLEVYEKYYTYTVKTNESGDFMIWGVPLGSQNIHVDVDLSDMGCQSLVPYDLIYEGISEEKFENKYTYMSSNNIETLPQIISFDKTIEVYPFWGNEDLCEIGITRTDFDLGERGVRLEPYAIMMGGTMTDSGNDSLTPNCNVDNQMGEKCRLTTTKGNIEAIRFTGEYEKDSNGVIITPLRPILEKIAIDSNIDENGSFFFRVPMNSGYFYTNEFGDFVESNDIKKGIPTRGTYRFRFSLDDDSGSKNNYTGKILIPNIREYHTNDVSYLGGHGTINSKSYSFSTNLNDYPDLSVINGSEIDAIADGQQGIPQDYFYQFRYGRVYTVSQFLNKYENKSGWEKVFSFFTRDRNESFIGVKEIWPENDCANTNNYFPINDAVRNHRFAFFIATIVSAIEYIGLYIQLIFKEFVCSILFAIAELLSSTGVSNAAAAKMFKRAKEFQFKNIFKLNLIVYPDCYDCSEDNAPAETIFRTPPITIADWTGSTVYATNFILEEKYQSSRPSGTCDSYLFTNNTASPISFPYLDCDQKTRTVTVPASGTTEVCAYHGQSQSGFLLTPTITVDGCSGANGFINDTDLYFVPSGGGFIGLSGATVGTKDGQYLFQQYIIEIDVYGGGSTYIPIGIGQSSPIVWDNDTTTWKIKDMYRNIGNTISAAYNTLFDEPVAGTCHDTQGEIKIKKIWVVDANVTPEEFDIDEVESGCSKYDYIIEDEKGKIGDMRLKGIVPPLSGSTGNVFADYQTAKAWYDLHRPELNGFFRPNTSVPYMWNQLDADYNDKILGEGAYAVGDCDPPMEYNVMGVASTYPKQFVEDRGDFRNEDARCIYKGRYYGAVKKKGPYWVDEELTKDGTLTGWSEFRDGVYTIVPLAGKTGELINSYRRRKLFGKLMCGGVTSYTFSNSWLSGILYFFQYKRRGADRFCKDCLVRKVEDDGTNNYYYRSTPYSPGYTYNTLYTGGMSGTMFTNKTKGFYGSQRTVDITDTFDQPFMTSLFRIAGLTGYKRDINYPTTIVDLGPRSTWIREICFDPQLDVNCSITRSIGTTSYKGIDDLMEYIIMSKEIKERGRLDVQDLFDRRGKGLIDGDIAQLLNFNTQTGIYPFENEESDSPYFNDYSESFDAKGPIGINFVYSGDDDETLTIEQDGFLIRECLNKPGRLGDNSQKVPYYMWDTRGHGFGETTEAGESQTFFTALIFNQRLQQMKAELNTDTVIGNSDDLYMGPEAEWVLPPIRDCVNGVKSNDNYKEYTVFGNTRHLMEIGGPFNFTFGLRKGATAFDKFIENFGPK